MIVQDPKPIKSISYRANGELAFQVGGGSDVEKIEPYHVYNGTWLRIWMHGKIAIRAPADAFIIWYV